MQIIAKQNTVLKTHPVDSNLKPQFLPVGFASFPFEKDRTLLATEALMDGGFNCKLTFSPYLTIAGTKYTTLYVFAPHWSGIGAIQESKVAVASLNSPAGSSETIHPHKHFAQRNNAYLGDEIRSGEYQCGLTSVAIALSNLMPQTEQDGLMSKYGSSQLDDAVGLMYESEGFESVVMESHVEAFKHLGFKAVARRDATIAELQDWLINKGPVVCGLNYNGAAAGGDVDSDSSGAGHFTCFVGFDRLKGEFIVADPYGDRKQTGGTNGWTAYFDDESQCFLSRYPIALVQALWAVHPDGWAVFPTPNARGGSTVVVTQVAPKAETIVQAKGLITEYMIAALSPDCENPGEIANSLNTAIELFSQNLSTPKRIAHFVGQCCHESDGFRALEEYATGEDYEGREDLGNVQEGDGVRFKGRSFIQTTGRTNYQNLTDELGAKLGVDFVKNPEKLALPEYAGIGAALWWNYAPINRKCDEGLDDAAIEGVTRVVNGGTNGLDDRIEKTKMIARLLGL